MLNYIEDQHYDKQDSHAVPAAEYDNCSFTHCDFASADLSGYIFNECQFKDCNLSNVRLDQTSFRQSEFINCKILGTHFDRCEPLLLSFTFKNCLLNYTSFYHLDLKNTLFSDCSLQETDFSECNLSGASFKECNLLDTVFDRTNIEKADFRSAFNYRIDPNNNKIKKARFSVAGLGGLLTTYQIDIE